MTDRDAAMDAIRAGIRRLRATTTGKGARDVPEAVRGEIARLEGALARLDAAEGRRPEHWGNGR